MVGKGGVWVVVGKGRSRGLGLVVGKGRSKGSGR